MMCWKDRTFCKFDDCGKWGDCERAFTEDKKKAAEKWWISGGGKAEDTPVCCYVDMPGCHSRKFAL
jgi:hypothetical protein